MSFTINTEDALMFLNGQGNSAALTVEDRTKLIQPLINQNFVWLYGRSSQEGTLRAGKYIFKVDYLPLSENYVNGQLTTQNAVIDPIESDTIVRRSIKFAYESLDMDPLAQAPQVVANYLTNLNTCYYIDVAQYFYSVMKKYGDAHPEQTFFIDELGKEDILSDDDAKKVQQLIAKRRAKIGRTINRKYFGVNMSEFYTVVDPYALIDLSIVLTRLNASTSAFEVSKNLIEGNPVDFNRIISDNLINLTLPKGASTNRDEDYDMSGVVGFIWQQDFMALPVRSPLYISRYNGDGNLEFIVKYEYTNAILRPELFVMLVTDLRAYVETKGTDMYVKCNAMFRDKEATYSSSDTNVATVDANGKITVVAAGTTTFTVSCLGKEATVEKTFTATQVSHQYNKSSVKK